MIIILASDGRHSTLGHYAEQSDIDAAAAALVAAGLSGWVCEMAGEYYSRRKVALAPVQQIGECDFGAAQTAFMAIRKAATK